MEPRTSRAATDVGAVMSLAPQLEAVGRIASSEERTAQYTRLLEQALHDTPSASLPSLVRTYVDGAVLDPVNTTGAGLLVGRHMLAHLATQLAAAHIPANILCTIVSDTLASCEASSIMWDDELGPWRVLLAEQHASLSRWRDAAQALQSITPHAARRIPQLSFAQLCVRVVELWLHDLPSHVAEAEQAIKRANSAILEERDNKALVHELWSYHARVLAIQHRFMEAAARYMDLPHADMYAAVYAIISPPSAQRTSMLTRLAQRASAWPFAQTLHHAAEGRFLRPADLEALAPFLGGVPVQPDVFVEHNVCVALSFFSSVPLTQLTRLVGLDAHEHGVQACEAAVARLLSQGVLPTDTCWIDQVTQAVYLDAPDAETDREARISACLQALDAAHARLSA